MVSWEAPEPNVNASVTLKPPNLSSSIRWHIGVLSSDGNSYDLLVITGLGPNLVN